MGRDIAYDCWSCDLLCAASSPDLYRINLQQVISLTIYHYISFESLVLVFVALLEPSLYCKCSIEITFLFF
jgi:hypothetical protein